MSLHLGLSTRDTRVFYSLSLHSPTLYLECLCTQIHLKFDLLQLSLPLQKLALKGECPCLYFLMFHKEFRQCTKECLVQKMFGVLRGKQNRLENSHVYCLTVPLNTNAKNGLSSQGSLDDSPVRAASPRPSSLSPHGTRMPKIKF